MKKRSKVRHKIYTKGMDFMTCDWEEPRTANVVINVKKFPDPAATIEDLQPIVHDIRSRATDMVITADFSDMGLVGFKRCASIIHLVQDVIEYTKDDNLLRKIYFKGTGMIFRTVYASIQMTIPRYFRDMIQFI